MNILSSLKKIIKKQSGEDSTAKTISSAINQIAENWAFGGSGNPFTAITLTTGVVEDQMQILAAPHITVYEGEEATEFDSITEWQESDKYYPEYGVMAFCEANDGGALTQTSNIQFKTNWIYIEGMGFSDDDEYPLPVLNPNMPSNGVLTLDNYSEDDKIIYTLENNTTNFLTSEPLSGNFEELIEYYDYLAGYDKIFYADSRHNLIATQNNIYTDEYPIIQLIGYEPEASPENFNKYYKVTIEYKETGLEYNVEELVNGGVTER